MDAIIMKLLLFKAIVYHLINLPLSSSSLSLSLSSSPAASPSYLVSQNCVDRNLRSGRCVRLNSCPQLVESFYSETRNEANGIDFQTFVSDLFCGFDGQYLLICCAALNPMENTLTIPRPHPRPHPHSHPRPYPRPTSNQPNNDHLLGSLFQFAPLTTLSGDGGAAIFASTSQIEPNSTMPSVVFQPSTSGPGTQMALPTLTATTTTTTLTSMPSPTIEPSTIPISIKPSTENCGISQGTTNRVVGGIETRRGSYPWIAALGYYDEMNPKDFKFLCAGSLISPKYILTSAHCVTSTLAVVRLGAHDLSRSSEPNAFDFQVKRKTIHKGFDIKSIANDIALLELNSTAPMTNFISTICLPEDNYFLYQDFVGMNPFVAGWGAKKHLGLTSKVLRDAQVPIVDRRSCERNYKTVFRFIEFSERLICAGNSHVDACQGDSGGPLMLPVQINGNSYRYFLLGIVSYGYECARNGFPGVYTRVASYVPWIKGNQS